MFKYLSIIFLLFLILLLFWFNFKNNLYYTHIYVMIFSFFISFFIVFIYKKLFKSNKSVKNYFLKLEKFIDKYGIYILIFWFFIFLNYITFSKHLNYQSSGFDLWIFDQVIYKYSQFQFPASSSIREIINIEWDHFHPILFFYWLIYKIYASPLVLLFLQNFFFVLWWLWIYKLSKHILNVPIIWFLLVFLYFIFRGNVNALLFDFHPIVIAISLFPWLFYFSFKKNWFAYFLLLIPILLSKENLSIYIIFFWIYQIFWQKQKIIWFLSIFIGIIYFYLVMKYFLPLMWWGWKYWSYDAIWANPVELIKNTFLHPILFIETLFSSETKIITYLHHLWSGLYIWLFNPVILLLIPAYAQKFLSSREEFWTLNFHYSIDIFWVVAISIIFVFSWIKNKYPKKYIYIFIFFCTYLFINNTIINLYKSPLLKLNYTLENKQTLDSIIKTLPKNIKISTQNDIIPHFSQNEFVYIFPNLWNSDYILINKKIWNLWPLEPWDNLEKYIKKLKNKEDFIDIKLPFIKWKLSFYEKYNLIKEENNILLFKKIKK